MITQDRLIELFEYRPQDGALIKRAARRGNTAGKESGCVTRTGYKQSRVDHTTYLTHRLVFMYHHGYFPKQVDHINGVKGDNRIENLRASDARTNGFNRPIYRSTSGVKNVSWRKERGYWEVVIVIPGRGQCVVGSSKDLEMAAMIAAEAREKYHGQFANHGSYRSTS